MCGDIEMRKGNVNAFREALSRHSRVQQELAGLMPHGPLRGDPGDAVAFLSAVHAPSDAPRQAFTLQRLTVRGLRRDDSSAAMLCRGLSDGVRMCMQMCGDVPTRWFGLSRAALGAGEGLQRTPIGWAMGHTPHHGQSDLTDPKLGVRIARGAATAVAADATPHRCREWLMP